MSLVGILPFLLGPVYGHALIVYSGISLLFSIIVLGRFYGCYHSAELMQWFVKIYLGLDAYVVNQFSSNSIYGNSSAPASNSLGVADAVLTLVSLGPL